MDNYCWTDGKGKHHFVYAKTLEEEAAELAARKALEERQRVEELQAQENTSFTVEPPSGAYADSSELRNEIIEYSKTYEMSPIEENLYVISDNDKYIVRQKGKLVDVSRDITEIEKAEHSEITYFYEEKSYKEPWRTLIAPIETEPTITIKTIIIKTQENF